MAEFTGLKSGELGGQIFIANLLLNVAGKKFLKSPYNNFWRYGQKSVWVCFFTHTEVVNLPVVVAATEKNVRMCSFRVTNLSLLADHQIITLITGICNA